MPLEFVSKKLSSPQVSKIDFLSVKAMGEWPNSTSKCTWNRLFSDIKNCGRMINVKDLSISLEDDSNLLTMEGNGICVAPESGCPQRIKVMSIPEELHRSLQRLC